MDALAPRTIIEGGALVVDDSSVQRMNVVSLLAEFGITRIREAGDGKSGLDVIVNATPRPALLVVDLEMPGMDGIEMLQALASDRNCPPFLIVSAQHPSLLSAIETMCQELGLPILGAFSKPLTHLNLRLALEGFGRMMQARQQAPSSEGQSVPIEALEAAIRYGEIKPHYQPKFDLATGELAGFEALARWQSVVLGNVPPQDFVNVAEANGLIGELTHVILIAVLAQMARWRAEGFEPCVAVNLSALLLSDRAFCDEIIHLPQANGIHPSQLILEITESALVKDAGAALGALGRLRLKGFQLAMDDYGTGFSTTQQLSRLPVTELKIDRSFVADAPNKPSLRTILTSMIRMGIDLGLTSVAEGVETEAQMRLLQSISCQQAQGYLLGRPMPGEAVQPWLQAQGAAVRTLITRGTARSQ